MIDLTTTVTGVVLNGFTAPTYILTADNPPALNARQSLVTSLGGTQTSVRTHAPSDPFRITETKPLKTQALPKAHPVTGAIPVVGRNKYETVVVKGVIPMVGQNPQQMEIRVTELIPAGAEVNDQANIAAAYSLLAAHYTREAANHFLKAKTGSI